IDEKMQPIYRVELNLWNRLTSLSAQERERILSWSQILQSLIENKNQRHAALKQHSPDFKGLFGGRDRPNSWMGR
ncbi:hypothetical protein, partial [Candidatus Phycosocius bacilliformis]|uniref:hypothetical protein n=1 Tax=Candidatus Phycosocius bacilliformis TaxID=1445552 RepID=UPI001EE08475